MPTLISRDKGPVAAAFPPSLAPGAEQHLFTSQARPLIKHLDFAGFEQDFSFANGFSSYRASAAQLPTLRKYHRGVLGCQAKAEALGSETVWAG